MALLVVFTQHLHWAPFSWGFVVLCRKKRTEGFLTSEWFLNLQVQASFLVMFYCSKQISWCFVNSQSWMAHLAGNILSNCIVIFKLFLKSVWPSSPVFSDHFIALVFGRISFKNLKSTVFMCACVCMYFSCFYVKQGSLVSVVSFGLQLKSKSPWLSQRGAEQQAHKHGEARCRGSSWKLISWSTSTRQREEVAGNSANVWNLKARLSPGI